MDLAPAPSGESSPLKTPVVEQGVVDEASGDAEEVVDPEKTRESQEEASQPESPADEDGSEEAWESESLYEDALQFIRDEQLRDGAGTDAPIYRHKFATLTRPFQCLTPALSTRRSLTGDGCMRLARQPSWRRRSVREKLRLRSCAQLSASYRLLSLKARRTTRTIHFLLLRSLANTRGARSFRSTIPLRMLLSCSKSPRTSSS